MAKGKHYIRLIHSQRWLNLRRHILSLHPICQECYKTGKITPAREVHHVVPVERALLLSEMERLMFDEHNLLAVCHACHDRIHTELGRSGKAQHRAQVSHQIDDVRKKFFD